MHRKLRNFELDKYWLRILWLAIQEAMHDVWGQTGIRVMGIAIGTAVIAAVFQFRYLGWNEALHNLKIWLTSIAAGLVVFLIFLILRSISKPCELQNDAIEQIASLASQLESHKLTRKPRLVCATFQFITVTYDKGAQLWRERYDLYNSKAFVLNFANLPYDDGKGISAAKVRAQIVWRYDNDSPGPSFFPAAWVDEDHGLVDIPVGYSKKLIIGIKSGEGIGCYWNGYSNPRIKVGDKHALDGPMLPYHGEMSIKLIGETDEVWYEQNWEWQEDVNHDCHPSIKQVFSTSTSVAH